MVRSTIPAPKRKENTIEAPLTPSVVRRASDTPIDTPLDSFFDAIYKKNYELALKRFNYYKLPKDKRETTNPQAHVISQFFKKTRRNELDLHVKDFLTKNIGSFWGENRTIPGYVLGTPQTVPHREFTDQITAFTAHIMDLWGLPETPEIKHEISAHIPETEQTPKHWLFLAVVNGHIGATKVLTKRLSTTTLNTVAMLYERDLELNARAAPREQRDAAAKIVKTELKARIKTYTENLCPRLSGQTRTPAQAQAKKPEETKITMSSDTLPDRSEPPAAYTAQTQAPAPHQAQNIVQWNDVALPVQNDPLEQINALIKEGEYDRAPELPRNLLALYTRYGNALLGRLENSDLDIKDNIKTLATLSERLAKPEQAEKPELSDSDILDDYLATKSWFERIIHACFSSARYKSAYIELHRQALEKNQPLSLTETFESAVQAVETAKEDNHEIARDMKTIRTYLGKFDAETSNFIAAFETTLNRLLDPAPDDHEILGLTEQDRVELTHGINNTLTELKALKGFIGCDLKVIETKISTKNQLDSAITNFSIAVNAAQRIAIAQTVQRSDEHADTLSKASQKAFSESMDQFHSVLAQITGEKAAQLPANQNQKNLPPSNATTFREGGGKNSDWLLEY